MASNERAHTFQFKPERYEATPRQACSASPDVDIRQGRALNGAAGRFSTDLPTSDARAQGIKQLVLNSI